MYICNSLVRRYFYFVEIKKNIRLKIKKDKDVKKEEIMHSLLRKMKMKIK